MKPDEARVTVPPPLSARVWAALRPGLAGVKRGFRRALEQTLHPSRRRAARTLLQVPEGWDRVLVLCYGNVCRSPFAAAILVRTFAERGISTAVLQGGFIGPGRRSPVSARAVAREHNIELRKHRSRLVTLADVQERTLVVVMDKNQARRVARELAVPRSRIVLLGDLDPHPIMSRTVTDPWGLEREVFEEVYARIARCAEALAECIRASSREGGAGTPGAQTAPNQDSSDPATPRDESPHIRSLHS